MALSIDALEAQEDLRLIKCLDFPMMKQDVRAKVHRELSNRAFPKILKGEPKALSMKDLARILGSG